MSKILPALLAASVGLGALALPLAAQAQTGNTASARRSMPAAVAPDAKVAALRDAAMKDDVAWDIVEGITTEVGPRPDGSEAEGRARDWAVAKLKALGFKNVHVEPYQLENIWERGVETASVVAPFPQPLRLTALGNSGATPTEGVTAPIVYFEGVNDLMLAPEGSLKGKIAFVSNAMQPTQDGSGYGTNGAARFLGPNIAAKKGALAIVIRSIGTDHGRGPHAGATNFETGVAPIPAAALSVADAENLERIVKRGKPVTLHLTLTPKFVGTRTSGNVVAEVPGTDPQAGIITVGGHLDSWDLGTGAIDDGAGFAITTAAAKRLMDAGKHRRTIRVVWFGDEEMGGFGGIAYAKAHASERHALAAESDSGADYVWKASTNFPDSAKAVGDRIAVALAPIGVVRGREAGPTLALGVAGIDLHQSALRYFDFHHTPEDTLDRIDPEQLRQNVAAWTAMLATVADAPEEFGAVPAKP